MGRQLTLNGWGNDYRVEMILTHYKDNGRTAVLFETVGDLREPFMTLSVNIPEIPVPDEEHFIAKTYSENEPFREQLLASGLFEDTGLRFPIGFVEVELWKLSPLSLS